MFKGLQSDLCFMICLRGCAGRFFRRARQKQVEQYGRARPTPQRRSLVKEEAIKGKAMPTQFFAKEVAIEIC